MGPINYFEGLGFGRAMDRPMQVAGQVQALRANEQGMDIRQQQAEMQRKQFEQQQAMMPQQQAQQQQAQQRQQLAEASGVLYGALQSGQTDRAASLAAQFEPLFKSLDPTFNAQQFAQMASTPEGLQQLNTELLQLTQVLAGPEQQARFAAQQARPQAQGIPPAKIQEFEYWKSVNPEATPEQQQSMLNRILDPGERALATALGAGQGRVATEQQLTPVMAERASRVETAKESTTGGQLAIERQKFENRINEEEKKLKEEARQQQRQVEIADTRSSLLDIDNLTSTVNRILEVPQNIQSAATGPIMSRVPTVRRSVADYEELINSFESQAFTAQVAKLKGMGALSDAEGRKLAAALGNVSLRQSPEQIQSNLNRVLAIMNRVRSNLIKKSGIPEQELMQQGSQPTQPQARNEADIFAEYGL